MLLETSERGSLEAPADKPHTHAVGARWVEGVGWRRDDMSDERSLHPRRREERGESREERGARSEERRHAYVPGVKARYGQRLALPLPLCRLCLAPTTASVMCQGTHLH